MPESGGGPDPFDTATFRRLILDSWAASPDRFREDANAEESLALGGYAGRLLIELAANAVDAAHAAGVPARIRFTLVESPDGSAELRAANTGAPLTRAGVAGLASLRASAKRSDVTAVGHFGVGFTAVLAVTDAPFVLSVNGGVGFDRVRSARAVAALAVPALDREVAARGGQVPALRLPWPADSWAGIDGQVSADGLFSSDEEFTSDGPFSSDGEFSTEVRLPLRRSGGGTSPRRADGRDPVELEQTRRLLTEVGDDLLWALPGLVEVQIILGGAFRLLTRHIGDDGTTEIVDHRRGPAVDERTARTFRTGSRSGTVPAELLADRPVEEQGRTQWRLTWFVPVALAVDPSDLFAPETGHPLRMLGAPTPTDEAMSLPAGLVGTFPVDDTRRRLAEGPLTDHLLSEAATAYVELVMKTPLADRLSLVPGGGFPAGGVDARLRSGILDGLRKVPMLETAAGESLAPADACVVPTIGPQGAMLLGRAVTGLIGAPTRRADLEALRRLDVRFADVAEVTSALGGIDGPPDFWRAVYTELAGSDAEDVGDLPVPLVGGGRRIGPRGCLLPTEGATGPGLLDRAVAAAPDIRIVHPDAAHPLLERLGAVPVGPSALLADPALAQAFHEFRQDLEDSASTGDPEPARLRLLARLGLDLVAAGGRTGAGGNTSGGAGGGLLADLVLTDADGEPWPAAELLAPGAPLAPCLYPDAELPFVGAEWTGLYSADVLSVAGVRNGLRVIEVPAGAAEDDVDLPDYRQWSADVLREDGGRLPWAGGTGGETFSAVADLDLIDRDRWPAALALLADDRAALDTLNSGPEPPYTRWWLSRHVRLAGERPGNWRAADALELAGLYDPLPVDVEPGLATAIGVLGSLDQAIRVDPGGVLDRFCDRRRSVAVGPLTRLTELLAEALRADPTLVLPPTVRAVTGEVVDAEEAMVLDRPWFAQVLPAATLVAGGSDPESVAAAFDLPLASEEVTVRVSGGGSERLPGAGLQIVEKITEGFGPGGPPVALQLVPDLAVSIGSLAPQRVSWWMDGGRLITDGTPDGIAKAVSWATGRWADRHLALSFATGDWAGVAEQTVR